VVDKMLLEPGTMIGGYRLTETIGRGGFAEVWSAWDTHLNRLVAIKLVTRSTDDAHNTIQFGREAAMISRLEYAHILPLYDFGETPDLRYLVMRYVTGGSLAQRLDHGRLSANEIIRLMIPVAETLDYIHEQRIVHRDLKPGNILLDAQGLPYLSDFGLAKQLSDDTAPLHSSSGTFTYMPPEQFTGSTLSVNSDQYSFGILLYQLFSGELPYQGEVALGMRQLSGSAGLPDITLANPQLPARLNELLWALTDTDPAQRPRSAVAVMKNIAEVMHGIDGADGAEVPTASSITFALDSGAYHQHEAESLLKLNLEPWQRGVFSLGLTHFVLLSVLLRDLPALVTPDVKSLILRGALQFNQQVDYWWNQCNDVERQRAIWNCIENGSEAVRLHALNLAISMFWVREASIETINNIGQRMMPLSDFTPVALEFLERSLPRHDSWVADFSLPDTDDNLRDLALSKSPLANRAATLIGSAHRIRAMSALPTAVRRANPILVAYESAGTLPRTFSASSRIALLIMLAGRQLIRNPLLALDLYAWAVLGNVFAVGTLIYVTYRVADPANIFSSARTLNTLGLGLLFGTIYGTGVWLARIISRRMRALPFVVRAALGIVVGGLVVAIGFSLFQQLVYDDVIDSSVALTSGLLYAAGFALSVSMPAVYQVVLGATGILLALLIPWGNYLVNSDLRPPFIFDETHSDSVWLLAGIAAVIAGFFTLGYAWRGLLRRKLFWQQQMPHFAADLAGASANEPADSRPGQAAL
jgi:serine/threonine protein kinase